MNFQTILQVCRSLFFIIILERFTSCTSTTIPSQSFFVCPLLVASPTPPQKKDIQNLSKQGENVHFLLSMYSLEHGQISVPLNKTESFPFHTSTRDHQFQRTTLGICHTFKAFSSMTNGLCRFFFREVGVGEGKLQKPSMGLPLNCLSAVTNITGRLASLQGLRHHHGLRCRR